MVGYVPRTLSVVIALIAVCVLSRVLVHEALSPELIGMMEEENKRDEREAYQLNSLGPLGDKKIWNFEIFPKV